MKRRPFDVSSVTGIGKARKMSKGVVFAGLMAVAFAAPPVPAQLLGGLPGPASGPVGQIGNTVGQLGNDIGRIGSARIDQPLGLPGGRNQAAAAADLISLDRVGLPLEPVYSTAAQLAQQHRPHQRPS